MPEPQRQQRRTEERPPVTAGAVVRALRERAGWFAVIGLAVLIIVNAIGFARTADGPRYHAEALIVATELEIRIESLPRTSTAIFNGGTVARTTAAVVGGDVAAEDLIPSVISVEPIENTHVIEVDGTHPDPELAAMYANVAAQALVDELNRIGPGLGVFALHIEATTPTDPLGDSLLPIFGLSLIAAMLLVLGSAILYAMITRPKSSVPPSGDAHGDGGVPRARDIDDTYRDWSFQDDRD